MGEIVSTLILFIDETMLYCIPALIIIGIAVKHCTDFPNNLIPLVEVGAGAVLGVCYGLACSADVGARIVDVIRYAGQGAMVGIVAIALYDMVHGVIKNFLSKMKEEKKDNEKA